MKAPLKGLGETPRPAGQEPSYRCDPESSAQPIQTSAETPPHASEQPNSLRTNVVETSEIPESPAKEASGRKDRGRRHAVRGSVLSRSLIQTLERLGENVRALRNMESELRATLKPQGALGGLFFDRFWASILRLILAARLEEGGLARQGVAGKNSASVPSLREGVLPILVVPEGGDISMDDPEKPTVFDSEVFRRLALVVRYDRSAAREMYRTMSLLLIMRSEGEAGLKYLRLIAKKEFSGRISKSARVSIIPCGRRRRKR